MPSDSSAPRANLEEQGVIRISAESLSITTIFCARGGTTGSESTQRLVFEAVALPPRKLDITR